MIDFASVKEIEIPEGSVNKIEIDGTKVWEKAVTPETDGLCFTAEQANSAVGYAIVGSLPDINIQYSYDGINWIDWNGIPLILNNVGDKVYVRNTANTLSTNNSNNLQFYMDGKIAASGNCNSMINYGELTNWCFYGMFFECTSLTKAPELPATLLAEFCYYYMFYNCKSLTQAPTLPATTLAYICYSEMFRDCTSLTQPPELPATQLAENCYQRMFQGCTSLTTAPELPATTLADRCYSEMFRDCTSLTQPPELPATQLVWGCYGSMFNGCTSLSQAPELPATQLATSCYEYMFKGCSSLKIRTTSGTKIFTCPETSGIPYDPVIDMFSNTGGTFTGTPTTGNTYYWYE